MTPEKSLYSDEVMDHYLHPRNSGELTNATLEVEQLNEVCGDKIILYLRVEDKVIVDVSYRSFGCAVAIAAASLVSEAIKGKTLSEAEQAAEDALATVREGTSRDKTHCSNMVAQVWKKAADQIRMLK